ncbi:MAG TPA: hypothetical protein VK996_14420 [Ramlibacter sp.]|nr:hypothetical protein [Ramlibacter sp.]
MSLLNNTSSDSPFRGESLLGSLVQWAMVCGAAGMSALIWLSVVQGAGPA